MGKAKTRPKVSKPHRSPAAVKKARPLKEKYGTERLSPEKCLRVRRALVDVQEKKSSIRKAAKDHSVSTSYLRRRLFGEVSVDSRNGPSPVFNKEEEEAMAKWLKEIAERVMELKPCEFLDFVEHVIKKEKRKTPFTGDRPSYKWYHKFKERNKHIVEIRKGTPLKSRRAKLSRQGVDEWYTNFKQFLIEHGLLHKPEHIYNADETVLNLSSEAGKVIGPDRSNKNIFCPTCFRRF